ncbi:MAG: hypothetical protein AAGB93_00875 [Planctomycetota bacterium]
MNSRASVLALACLAAPAAPAALAQSPWTRLGSDLVEPDAFTGMGIAFEGDILLAGAPYSVSGQARSGFHPTDLDPPGALLAYEEIAGTWTLAQHVQASDAVPADRFGMAIVVAGDLAFVAAPGAIDGGVRTGAVYRFERVGGQWVERQKLVPQDAQAFAAFGNHLDLDGDQLLVGAPMHSAAGVLEWGRGFVFERTPGGDWMETGALVPPPMPDEAWAGYRVAIDGDRAALGVYGDRTNGNGAGAVCVFERTPGGWLPVQQVLPQRGTRFAHFSFSLLLDGDLLVAGSFRGGVERHHCGSVHVFRHDGASFREVQELLPPGHEFGASFGETAWLSESGELLAGMPGSDRIGGRIAVHRPLPDGTFELESIQWPPQTQHVDCFGWKVRTSNGRIAATAAVAYVAGERRGAVYVWDPAAVGHETPRCAGSTGPGAGPQQVLLRARGGIASGSSTAALVATELPPHATALLFAGSPNARTDAFGFACIGTPYVRLSPPAAADARGALTWSLSATPAAGLITAGSTWSFQVWAWDGAAAHHSNALDLRFEP